MNNSNSSATLTVESKLDNKKVDIISCHIPKTGGSAFEKVLYRVYGREKCFTDSNHQYSIKEVFENDLINTNTKIIHGHFRPKKYDKYFPDATKIVWLRNPVARIMSLYYFLKYRSAENDRSKKEILENNLDLRAFAELKANMFTQKHLNDVSLDDFSFVGIQEFFLEDIKDIANLLDWSKQERKRAIDKTKVTNPTTKFLPTYQEEVDAALANRELIREIATINKDDMELYKTALENRAKRKEISKSQDQLSLSIDAYERQLNRINIQQNTLIFQKEQIKKLQLIQSHLN